MFVEGDEMCANNYGTIGKRDALLGPAPVLLIVSKHAQPLPQSHTLKHLFGQVKGQETKTHSC